MQEKLCPICGKKVIQKPGEENAKVYHMECLEKSIKKVVIK